MFDTLRQFGHERLASRNAGDLARTRHAVYFAELADRGLVEVFGPDQLRWHRLFELEQDSFRAALAWAVEIHDPSMLLRLATGAAWFWMVRGQWSEGRRWLDRALSMTSSMTDRGVGEALFIAGALAWLLGDLGASRHCAEACLRVAEEAVDEGLRSRALLNLGTLEQIRNDFAGAERSLHECLRCARAAGDRWVQGRALDMLAAGALHSGTLEQAAAYLDESASIARAAEDAWSLCISLNARGDVARMRARFGSLKSWYAATRAPPYPASARMKLRGAAGSAVAVCPVPSVVAQAGVSSTRTSTFSPAQEAARKMLSKSLAPLSQA
ncbi:MAG TPA: hypothetical protein VFG86_14540 [Chloroflexota bacterium]|jgi:tetratricopeptide (TPR) repeat protein|nr:hypothetical protein [Chloroflexota bacterium]